LTINPASTVISGVVNYLVKATLPTSRTLKPGMTVNMTIWSQKIRRFGRAEQRD